MLIKYEVDYVYDELVRGGPRAPGWADKNLTFRGKTTVETDQNLEDLTSDADMIMTIKSQIASRNPHRVNIQIRKVEKVVTIFPTDQ